MWLVTQADPEAERKLLQKDELGRRSLRLWCICAQPKLAVIVCCKEQSCMHVAPALVAAHDATAGAGATAAT